MSAVTVLLRLIVAVLRSKAVVDATAELGSALATNAGRAAAAAIIRSIKSGRAIRD